MVVVVGVGKGGLGKEGNCVPYCNDIGLPLNPLTYKKLSLPKMCNLLWETPHLFNETKHYGKYSSYYMAALL